MCNSLFLEESEERRKCFLNVRLMFAKIRGIFEMNKVFNKNIISVITCLLYTSPSPRDTERSRMPSSA